MGGSESGFDLEEHEGIDRLGRALVFERPGDFDRALEVFAEKETGSQTHTGESEKIFLLGQGLVQIEAANVIEGVKAPLARQLPVLLLLGGLEQGRGAEFAGEEPATVSEGFGFEITTNRRGTAPGELLTVDERVGRGLALAWSWLYSGLVVA